MLKIHPIYRVYDYSRHKAVLSLLKAGFIKEEDLDKLVYHELNYIKNEGDTRLFGIDWNNTAPKLYTLDEIYKMYNADLFRFCVTICCKRGDSLFPTGILTFRFANAQMCVQADAEIIPDSTLN
jgi:hypothetical protein